VPSRHPFHRRPRFWRSCLDSSSDYGLPFHEPKARFPVTLDSAQQSRIIPPASPTSKLSSPHRSVRNQPELPRPGGRYSFGFFLSRVFSVHALRPRTRPGLADLNTSSPPVDAKPATLETSSLKSRVKPSWPQKHPGRPRRQLPALVRTGPDRLVGGHRSSPGLRTPSPKTQCSRPTEFRSPWLAAFLPKERLLF
jgi:hypothetical protein